MLTRVRVEREGDEPPIAPRSRQEAIRSSQHGPSFLRWAGSKRKSLAVLRSLYCAETRYVEPFAGSAALFFEVRPQSGVLADLNGHLVNALRAVRDNPRAVHAQLASLKRDATSYYEARKSFQVMRPYGLEAAVAFIYLNRNCFNGLWRTNKRGHFNVPYGGSEMGSNPPLGLLNACSLALQRVSLRHQDFRKTIRLCGAGDFVYADPPYFTSGVRTFVEYGRASFGAADLSDLSRALVEASERGSRVVMTYADDADIPSIPAHWTRTRFEVTRNVGGFKNARRRQNEVIYTSFDPGTLA
jgi:DNA adenine methylase